MIDGKQEKELQGIDMGESLYKIRKKISEEILSFKGMDFTFTKRINDGKDLLIPSVYENESMVRLGQVAKTDKDNVTKVYVKSKSHK